MLTINDPSNAEIRRRSDIISNIYNASRLHIPAVRCIVSTRNPVLQRPLIITNYLILTNQKFILNKNLR